MPEVTASGERLDQWKGIAEYLGRDVSTVIRWSKENGLPVHRVPGNQRRRPVFAYRHEIDDWLLSSGQIGPVGEINHILPLTGELSPVMRASQEPQAQTCEVAGETGDAPLARPYRVRFRFGVALAIAFLTVGGILALTDHLFAHRIQTGGETLILSDSYALDPNFVPAGGTLYFGAWHAGRIALMSVSETGGPTREIPVPFVQSQPQGISADGTRLLVLAGAGQETERQLWWVPVNGNPPARVGNLLCHAAAPSPDGRTLAFAFGNAIYLATDDGAIAHRLHSFTELPRELRWSLDGRRIMTVVSSQTERSTIWKLTLDRRRPFTLDSIALVAQFSRHDASLSPVLNDQDDIFVGGDKTDPAIYLLRGAQFPWSRLTRTEVIARPKGGVSGLALDRETHQLFYGRSSNQRDELEIVDRDSTNARPFMAGVSAHDVDFCRDGRRIAYVSDPPLPLNTLWIANAEGGYARQVDTRGLDDIELPRWSPDGRQLAFMGRRSGEPFRIYVVSSSGGKPREASRSGDNQGAPTWSPDGRSLVYGRVLCQEANPCAIYRIDVASGSVSMIPGSEELSTARWSPDGHSIVALRADTHQLFLFDLRTQRWSKLADGINGNDLAWSSDSRAVYASRPDGSRPAILRISLSGRIEEALNLTPWMQLSGRVDTWFTVAPNGSLLFVRLVAGTEIVALH